MSGGGRDVWFGWGWVCEVGVVRDSVEIGLGVRVEWVGLGWVWFGVVWCSVEL